MSPLAQLAIIETPQFVAAFAIYCLSSFNVFRLFCRLSIRNVSQKLMKLIDFQISKLPIECYTTSWKVSGVITAYKKMLFH